MEGEPIPVGSLTRRELDILRLVALGLSNRDIAEELVVAPETVRWYTKQIYSKLGAHGRVHALVRAKELGLLTDTASNQMLTTASLSRPKDNLPVPITSLIGRNHEIT
jgi:DNA-binding CsgD family transcriptional regulator